jgi:hypothetical protein
MGEVSIWIISDGEKIFGIFGDSKMDLSVWLLVLRAEKASELREWMLKR